METQELITKVEKIIPRDNGSEVKIVVQEMRGIGLTASIDVYVLRRESAQHDWRLCNDRPHKDWRSMSVDEYVKRGRSEKLRTVSPGEILNLIKLIGQPMTSLH